ncbi:hypothetical protein WQ57_12345 [Mesobacillus campisalis]|uniref:Uncharacterized protein n=2 Tax=Mesobacillus campisalis TaxID=1408103 RepID=A0A0M2SXM8_9BACI|nr:hypothetical protein [Mesobacillus campisalis]KKK37742.1 hypothetical protein WQ57_12345 [Mesobacillus campisalis]
MNERDHSSKDEKVVDALSPSEKEMIEAEVAGMKFTKNFRSPTAEEWYVFLPGFHDPQTGGAAGKAIIHYDLFGNREIFINTTIIFDDPKLHHTQMHRLVYALADELVNVLVGYADTLLSVHSGSNSYQAEYKSS